MSVDVGMDVHRQRSPVAIVDEAGAPAQPRPPPRSGQADPGPWHLAARHAGGVRGGLRLGLAGGVAGGAGAGAAAGAAQPLQAITAARLKNDQVAAASTLAPLLGAD